MKFLGALKVQPPYQRKLETRRQEMIRKLKTGMYRIYSLSINPKTGKRRNLGTFKTREEAVKHEREIQYFKRRSG